MFRWKFSETNGRRIQDYDTPNCRMRPDVSRSANDVGHPHHAADRLRLARWHITPPKKESTFLSAIPN